MAYIGLHTSLVSCSGTNGDTETRSTGPRSRDDKAPKRYGRPRLRLRGVLESKLNIVHIYAGPALEALAVESIPPL